jgi:hypothetical protein
MNVELHQLISDRLDLLKQKRWVGDYLISWNGHGGRLVPKIAVWSAGNCSDDDLAGELNWLVGELVDASEITILPPVSQAHSAA